MNNITFQFWEGEIAPSSTADGEGTFTVISKVKDAVPIVTASGVDQISHNPFPEGLEEGKIPSVVQESWKEVKEQNFPLEKLQQISYYINAEWRWCMKMGSIANILMTNETATNNPSAGINVKNGNTYFSQPAAQKHAKNKWQELPTNARWTKMADFLGGFKQLKEILQIPLNGWFRAGDGLQVAGRFANVWSSSVGEYLDVVADDGSVSYGVDTSCGLSVRLLDT